MQMENSPTYIFNTHVEAEEAIRSLSRSGFDMQKLSLIGKGYHSEEHPVGFYTTGDKIKAWGKSGAFWGGIWGLLIAPAVFLIPGLGLLAMAGPIVPTLVGGLEGAVLVGGFSALGAALTQIGVRTCLGQRLFALRGRGHRGQVKQPLQLLPIVGLQRHSLSVLSMK